MPGDNDNPSPFGQSVTADDYEAATDESSNQKPDLSKVVADGDDIPEAYRGKSVTEIIKIAETSRGAMNDSVEASRQAAEAARAAAEASRAPAPPAPEAPKELTREELKAMYDEDPLAAIELMNTQALRRAEAHVSARLDGLTEGTVAQAENWAKQEFADEFELFGDEIKKMVGGISNKAVFTTKQGWQDAVAYVRGKAGNFEKLVEHRTNKENGAARDEARKGQRDSSGFTGRNVSANGRSRDVADSAATKDMGDDEKAIAQRFIDNGTFKDMAEYKRWQRMGG